MTKPIIYLLPLSPNPIVFDYTHGNWFSKTKQEDPMNRITVIFAMVLSLAALARADIRTQTVEYKDGDTVLEGYLAYDDSLPGKRPGVVIVHDWMGISDNTKMRAEQMAKLGYVAFAAAYPGYAVIHYG